jgi:hypothetical protein
VLAGQFLLCWPSRCARWPRSLIPCRGLLRRQVTETRVQLFAIIFAPPLSDLVARNVEGDKDVLFKAFDARPPNSSFDVCILDRFTRFDEL